MVHSTFELFYARSENCEKRILASSCLSVCLSVCLSYRPSTRNISAPTGRIFMKYYWRCFENLSRQFVFDYISITTATLYQALITSAIISIISRPILLRMRNVSHKVVEKIETLLYSRMEKFNRERSLCHIRWRFLFPFLSRNITVTYCGISGWSGYVARMRSSEIQTKALSVNLVKFYT